MHHCRPIIFATFGFIILLFSSCIRLPTHFSELSNVYPRTDRNNATNEVVIEVRSGSGTIYPLTPEGQQETISRYQRRYYFSDRHVRRRLLPFLGRNDVDTWDIFAPVEGTNCWIRVEGPRVRYGKSTNSVLITVFTPRELLYQQSIAMTSFPGTNYLHFDEGNRLVAYKSDDDDFVYDVLQNSLKKTGRTK